MSLKKTGSGKQEQHGLVGGAGEHEALPGVGEGGGQPGAGAGRLRLQGPPTQILSFRRSQATLRY
jgi:hypothetical protein